MLKVIYLVVAVMAIFSVFVAMQPEDFKIERSLEIEAPAADIFANVNNFHKWAAWSPWAKLDPDAKTSFEGSDAGAGAIMKWEGNNQVGTGSMTIAQSKLNEFIQFKMEFLKPMESKSTAEFAFVENEGKTKVTWRMYGKNNFIGKAMGVIFNCNKMVGEKFEQGLANLSQVVKK